MTRHTEGFQRRYHTTTVSFFLSDDCIPLPFPQLIQSNRTKSEQLSCASSLIGREGVTIQVDCCMWLLYNWSRIPCACCLDRGDPIGDSSLLLGGTISASGFVVSFLPCLLLYLSLWLRRFVPSVPFLRFRSLARSFVAFLRCLRFLRSIPSVPFLRSVPLLPSLSQPLASPFRSFLGPVRFLRSVTSVPFRSIPSVRFFVSFLR